MQNRPAFDVTTVGIRLGISTAVATFAWVGFEHWAGTATPPPLLAAGVATLFGILPASYGIPSWLCLLVAAGVLTFTFFSLSAPLPSSLQRMD